MASRFPAKSFCGNARLESTQVLKQMYSGRGCGWASSAEWCSTHLGNSLLAWLHPPLSPLRFCCQLLFFPVVYCIALSATYPLSTFASCPPPLPLTYCTDNSTSAPNELSFSCRPCQSPQFSFYPSAPSCSQCASLPANSWAVCNEAALVPADGFYQSHPRSPVVGLHDGQL